MRNRIVFASLALLLLGVGRSYGTVKIESSVRQYDDSMTKVLSPSIDAEASFSKEHGKVKLGYGMDILTSASPDVVSFGTKEIKETRKELSFGTDYTLGSGSIGGGYVQSDENDYSSKNFSFGGTRDFFEKNTVIGMGFSQSTDKITSSTDSSFIRDMSAHMYNISVSQVTSKQGILQLLYDFRVEAGYTASPYRRARFRQPDGSVIPVPENHPRNRGRNAVTAKYNHFIAELVMATASSLRFYFDTWGVRSWTLEEKVTREFSKKFSLGVSFRYYRQAAANFYQDFYAANADGYFTGNKTLAEYSSMLLGLRANFVLSEKFSFFVKMEKYNQSFDNFTDVKNVATPLDDAIFKIDATVYGVGLNGTF
ncbi:MAG: DUF3570 domain-containing protein [Bdellovibrionales bacterium]|nr:DUF3570 domain-containing protein [Bdellovibrionales bacterium]